MLNYFNITSKNKNFWFIFIIFYNKHKLTFNYKIRYVLINKLNLLNFQFTLKFWINFFYLLIFNNIIHKKVEKFILKFKQSKKELKLFDNQTVLLKNYKQFTKIIMLYCLCKVKRFFFQNLLFFILLNTGRYYKTLSVLKKQKTINIKIINHILLIDNKFFYNQFKTKNAITYKNNLKQLTQNQLFQFKKFMLKSIIRKSLLNSWVQLQIKNKKTIKKNLIRYGQYVFYLTLLQHYIFCDQLLIFNQKAKFCYLQTIKQKTKNYLWIKKFLNLQLNNKTTDGDIRKQPIEYKLTGLTLKPETDFLPIIN